jgi:hypothetical protein
MDYPTPCIWKDRLCFRFDRNGKVIEAWYTLIDWDGTYSGREIIWPEFWK